MRYLLDTHALIWSQDETTRLSGVATAVLSNPANHLVLSVATTWEIGIKVSLGKLQLSKGYREWIETACRDLSLTNLSISVGQIERQMTLPFHHRDPFDRLLVAQALVEGFTLVSADAIFDAYGVSRIWN